MRSSGRHTGTTTHCVELLHGFLHAVTGNLQEGHPILPLTLCTRAFAAGGGAGPRSRATVLSINGGRAGFLTTPKIRNGKAIAELHYRTSSLQSVSESCIYRRVPLSSMLVTSITEVFRCENEKVICVTVNARR